MCQSFPLFYLRLSCIQSYVHQFQAWISLANPEIMNTGIYNCAVWWLSWPSLCAKASVQREGHNNKITAL